MPPSAAAGPVSSGCSPTCPCRRPGRTSCEGGRTRFRQACASRTGRCRPTRPISSTAGGGALTFTRVPFPETPKARIDGAGRNRWRRGVSCCGPAGTSTTRRWCASTWPCRCATPRGASRPPRVRTTSARPPSAGSRLGLVVHLRRQHLAHEVRVEERVVVERLGELALLLELRLRQLEEVHGEVVEHHLEPELGHELLDERR